MTKPSSTFSLITQKTAGLLTNRMNCVQPSLAPPGVAESLPFWAVHPTRGRFPVTTLSTWSSNSKSSLWSLFGCLASIASIAGHSSKCLLIWASSFEALARVVGLSSVWSSSGRLSHALQASANFILRVRSSSKLVGRLVPPLLEALAAIDGSMISLGATAGALLASAGSACSAAGADDWLSGVPESKMLVASGTARGSGLVSSCCCLRVECLWRHSSLCFCIQHDEDRTLVAGCALWRWLPGGARPDLRVAINHPGHPHQRVVELLVPLAVLGSPLHLAARHGAGRASDQVLFRRS